jgi:dTDP-4-dehydrorhamnose reductase
MIKFLLTGGTGRLGQELQKLLKVFAPTKAELNIRWHYCDTDFFLNNARKMEGIDTIIHCAAYTNVPGAEENMHHAVESNILGVQNVMQLAHDMEEFFDRQHIKVIYISSDYVYAGTTGNYKETDKTNPFNFYGFTKLAGESYINKEKDLIIRTSFKPKGQWPYPQAFTDLYTSADYVDIIAKEIALVAKSDMAGIINIGTERKSIYDLAARRTPDVGKMSRAEVSSVNMPMDISMNIDKFLEFKKSLGGKKNGRRKR